MSDGETRNDEKLEEEEEDDVSDGEADAVPDDVPVLPRYPARRRRPPVCLRDCETAEQLEEEEEERSIVDLCSIRERREI